MNMAFPMPGRRRGTGRAAVLVAAALAACGGNGTTTEPPDTKDPDPPPYSNVRTLPDTIELQPFVDSIKEHMPGSGSDGYDPPTADQRIRFLAILDEVRAGDLFHADSLADAFRYDIEPTVDALHGDTLIVMIERAPIERGWGTYVLRKGGTAADVHVNHPLHDTNTPRVATALYDACRCRALLVAGTHRYANGGDESDMARSITSVFQEMHEALADDALMVVSVHGFARDNHDEPIASADAVLSMGVDAEGERVTNDDARALRDTLVDAGFVAGLVADDEGYDQLTGSVNPQGRYSNNTFGHGRWLHMELAREVRTEATAWQELTGIVADWIEYELSLNLNDTGRSRSARR